MALDLCGFVSKPLLGDRVVKRQIDELIQLAEAAVLDESLARHEAESVCIWLDSNAARLAVSPADVLFERLRSMLADEVLGADERRDLLGLIATFAARDGGDASMARSPLPLTLPAPQIVYPGKSFCFAGVFEFGCRAECHEAVIANGGEPVKNVAGELDYLVVGSIGAEFWRQASFGSKITNAMRERDSGVSVAIVSEQYWVSGLR